VTDQPASPNELIVMNELMAADINTDATKIIRGLQAALPDATIRTFEDIAAEFRVPRGTSLVFNYTTETYEPDSDLTGDRAIHFIPPQGRNLYRDYLLAGKTPNQAAIAVLEILLGVKP
jgi:hypothetical protein